MAKKQKKSRTRRGTRTTVSREVIEGDIKRITKVTKTIEPAGPKKAEKTLGNTLKKAPEVHQARRAEPVNTDEEFGMQACRASMANGYQWVHRPCAKVMNSRRIYFNSPAIKLFGLIPGTLLLISVTKTGKELRFRSVRRKFANRTSVHRDGYYKVHDASTRSRNHDVEMVSISAMGKAGISLFRKYPGMIGHVFPIRQHPKDRNLLLGVVSESYVPDESIVTKLLLSSQFPRVLESQLQTKS